MKKFLPILAFTALFIASLVYLLPSFHTNYKEKTYVFTNLPSLTDGSIKGLQFQIPRLSPTYKYTIESATALGDKDWNLLATKDQKTLERRIESFIGKGYEIRLDNVEGKAVFSIFTQTPFGTSTSVLTTNNGDFTISSQEPTASDSTETATDETEQQNLLTLNLKRSDFGDSTVSATQQDSQVRYDIKLPINTLSVEKINLIKSKAGSQINVFIGGKDYSGSFLSNLNGAPTELVITSAASIEEAAALRTYLNTDAYYNGYTVKNVEQYTTKYGWAKLGGIVALFVVAALVLSVVTKKQVKAKQLLLIGALTIIGLATLKLFGLAVTTGVITVFGLVILFTLLQVRTLYYLGFAAIMALIQLLGYLYFFELGWGQIIILLIISTLIWSTNYYDFITKK